MAQAFSLCAPFEDGSLLLVQPCDSPLVNKAARIAPALLGAAMLVSALLGASMLVSAAA